MITKKIKEKCVDYWNIENYDKALNDQTQMWELHHRLEINEEGHTIYSKKQLIEMNMYMKRPSEELIFLTRKEHRKLHCSTPEFKESVSGENNGFYGRKHIDETLDKIGNHHKGIKLSDETKKKMSKIRKGRHWFNNGIEQKWCYECPEGWQLGRIKWK